MRLLTLLLAMAWPSSQALAAACGPFNLQINGFDLAGSCTTVAEAALFTSNQPLVSKAPGTVPGEAVNVEGNQYGRTNFTGNAFQMTLTAASFPAAVGTNWTSHDFIMVSYASVSTTGVGFTGGYYLGTGAGTVFFSAQSGNITRAAYASVSDWTPLILSLNYAKNLGVDLSAMSSISIREQGSGTFPVGLAFDALTLANGGDAPYPSLGPSDLAVTPSCASHNVTLTGKASTGTDPIAGYHIYRSTSGAAGPYVSYRYVNQAANPSFTESGPLFYNNVYYKVLPYSVSTTAFLGGAVGYFTKGGNSAVDPQNAGAIGGVHEDLLANATAIGPFNQSAACSPTFSPSFSATPSITPTITPTPTNTPSSTATPTITPTATPTLSPLGTSTFTSTLTQSFTPGPTAIPPAPTSTITQTPLPPPPTATITPSPSISPTFTISPIVTPTINPNAGAQLFPNPFHPDRGETFHLGNLPAGLKVNIYNIIGEFVIGFTTKGNPTEDRWDSLNANGVRVVTGIYFLQIDGKVYRVAVVRG